MTPIPTANAVSAGGVVFRQQEGKIEVALILVGPKLRWQLPKGTVNPDERIEQAALREVREETGIEADLLDLLEKIEYWFYANQDGQRTRFHKIVHFYLMRFRSGDVKDHDHEVEEARWVEIDQAIDYLSFESEKGIVRKTKSLVLDRNAADKQVREQKNAKHTPDLRPGSQEGSQGENANA